VPLSIREMSDRMEIEQLLIRYCHAIDQRDREGHRAVCQPIQGVPPRLSPSQRARDGCR
jgi:hypothetical protein